jgi:hypothetical protein
MKRDSLSGMILTGTLLAAALAAPARAEWPTAWSGQMPRPVLFVHGINSDYKTWGVSPAVNHSNFYCTSVTCFYDSYEWSCLAYRDGSVSKYDAGSAPAELAAKYAIPADGLVADAPVKTQLSNVTSGSKQTSQFTNPATKINHNGIEFYNSISYRSNGATFCALASLPNDAVNPLTDPFATLTYTNGVNTDSHTGWGDNHVEQMYQLGQTDQVYKKLAAVLDEYFTDWKTNKARTLDVVCHSQGCLATRSAIATFRSAGLDNPVNHINAIVSMDSPAIGTALALDGNGVHSIQRMRDIVIKQIYNKGGLDPVHIAGIKVDPFKDIRTILENFILRQTELAYPNDFTRATWQPSASGIATTGVTNGSPFISNLFSNGSAPITRPVDGSKIPLTAYYGTVPTLATKLLNYGVNAGLNACNQGAINGNEILALAQGLGLTDKTCHGWVNYIQSNLSPIFTEMDQQWTPYSDMVVDQSSQEYNGKLNPFNHPFISKKLAPFPGDLGVPHMTVGGVGANGGDLRGSTLHGKEILDALLNPPKQKAGISPLLSLLLEN